MESNPNMDSGMESHKSNSQKRVYYFEEAVELIGENSF